MFIQHRDRTRRDNHASHRACVRHTSQPVGAPQPKLSDTTAHARIATWRPANHESLRLSVPRSTTSLLRSYRRTTTKEGRCSDSVLSYCTHTDVTRRTYLDREPKVANQHIDLLRLYKRVNDEGGYDKVSDTKNNKLAWRRLAADFLQDSSASQLTTQAFLIKTAYYKNLACAFHCSCARKLLTAVSGLMRYRRYINATRPLKKSSRTSPLREEIC